VYLSAVTSVRLPGDEAVLSLAWFNSPFLSILSSGHCIYVLDLDRKAIVQRLEIDFRLRHHELFQYALAPQASPVGHSMFV
jgi:hypothetical protein